MVRPGLQHQSDGRGHRRGQFPLPGGSGGALRCPEAPPGPALLRILVPRLTQLVDVKTERYHSCPFFSIKFICSFYEMLFKFLHLDFFFFYSF